jgi:hypothetical protein
MMSFSDQSDFEISFGVLYVIQGSPRKRGLSFYFVTSMTKDSLLLLKGHSSLFLPDWRGVCL